MKFTVRQGFVVHDRKVVVVANNPQVQETSYYEGQQVEFDAAEADEHLHKLEPIDKAAREYVESKHPVIVPPVAAGIDYAALATAVVAAMAAASAAPVVANKPVTA